MNLKQVLKKKREEGQSIVELVVALFAYFTILFMFVQVALSLGIANFVQYATFMAARAFMSGAANQAEQKAAAQSVIDSMLKDEDGNVKFASIIQADEDAEFIGSGPGVQPVQSEGVRLTAWEQGVTYKFKTKIYMLPIIRSSGGENSVTLKSESWLGRHPTEAECLNYMNDIGPKRKEVQGRQFLFDNGC